MAVRCRALLRTGEVVTRGTTRELGTGGATLELDTPPPLSATTGTLELDLSDHGRRTFGARILRSGRSRDGLPILVLGLSTRDAESGAALSGFVTDRLA